MIDRVCTAAYSQVVSCKLKHNVVTLFVPPAGDFSESRTDLMVFHHFQHRSVLLGSLLHHRRPPGHLLVIVVNTTSDTLDGDSPNAAPSDLLLRGNGQALLVVVSSCCECAAHSCTLKRSGNDVLALDAQDVEAVGDP